LRVPAARTKLSVATSVIDMDKFIVKLPSTGSKRDMSSAGSESSKKQKAQSCLSFGQKMSRPSRQQCVHCGILFDASIKGDIATHQKECSKVG
jgi:hypothetical protein